MTCASVLEVRTMTWAQAHHAPTRYSNIWLVHKHQRSKVRLHDHDHSSTRISETMFVPRALRLKGVQEKQRPKPSKPPPADVSAQNKDDELVDAMEGISTNSPESQTAQIDQQVAPRGPKFTVKPITPEYIAQLAAGVGLIFSDYAHQERVRSKWLKERYRTVDGEEKCKHSQVLSEHTTNHEFSRPPYRYSREPQYLDYEA